MRCTNTSLSDPSWLRSMHVVALESGTSSGDTSSKSPSNSWTSGICAKAFWQSDCSDVLLRLSEKGERKAQALDAEGAVDLVEIAGEADVGAGAVLADAGGLVGVHERGLLERESGEKGHVEIGQRVLRGQLAREPVIGGQRRRRRRGRRSRQGRLGRRRRRSRIAAKTRPSGPNGPIGSSRGVERRGSAASEDAEPSGQRRRRFQPLPRPRLQKLPHAEQPHQILHRGNVEPALRPAGWADSRSGASPARAARSLRRRRAAAVCD